MDYEVQYVPLRRTRRVLFALVFVLMVVAIVAIILALGKHPEDVFNVNTILEISNMIIEKFEDDDEHKHDPAEFSDINHIFDPQNNFDPRSHNHPWYELIMNTPYNQGSCGSCASFATATMLADRYNVHQYTNGNNNSKLRLSPQSLLDALDTPSHCGSDLPPYNKCKCGEAASRVLDKAKTHGGAPLVDQCELSEYRAGNFKSSRTVEENDCPEPNCFFPASKTSDCANIVKCRYWRFTNSEVQAEEVLRKTGTLVTIITTSDWFNNNKRSKEVLNPPPKNQQGRILGGHMVCIIGVTRSYWIIRNSWGDSYHTKGFFRLKKGVNALELATNGIFYTMF